MEQTLYTFLIYSENVTGILNQITAVFTRRQVNIESLNVSPSGIEGVHKYTITIYTDADLVEKIKKQIEKKVDVIKADYYTNDEIFISEVALFKLSMEKVLNEPEISRVIRRSSARILEVNDTFCTAHIYGSTKRILDLRHALAQYDCILQYTRSGRIAITRKKEEEVSRFLKEQKLQQLMFMEEGINKKGEDLF